jgi:hypothetical protein
MGQVRRESLSGHDKERRHARTRTDESGQSARFAANTIRTGSCGLLRIQKQLRYVIG